YATSDLNDLYRRVINRNNRLKKLMAIKAPDVIIRNEKRMLQEAVDALIDNSSRYGTQQMSSRRRPLRSLADMLKGKQGRFRQNLLGKRVDYSGRSVIVVGPKLALDECGIPKKMALEIFRPFVIGEMLRREIAHNIRAANRIIRQEGDEVWEILEEVIRGRRVLLNRAPTLHRLSIQAFRPVLVEGLALQIPPSVCVAFNADFDGDQMAVHLPLSKIAQREVKEIMAANRNILKPATGEIIVAPTQDIVLGIYYLTTLQESDQVRLFANEQDALIAYNFSLIGLRDKIKIRHEGEMLETSVGRILFNRAIGNRLPFVNEVLNKKKLRKVIERVFELHGFAAAVEVLNKVVQLGFESATRSGITWAMADLIIPKEKKEILERADREVAHVKHLYEIGMLTEEERRARVIGIWDEAKNKISKLMGPTLPKDNSIYQIIDSGSRGSWAQPLQMMGMKGLVQNPRGETIELPIKSSFKEGFNTLEYFISTHGARKGTTDTALKTAQAGYLTRRLVDVVQDVIVREEDCGTRTGIEISRSSAQSFHQPFSERIFSRMLVEDVKAGRKILARAGEIISRQTAAAIEAAGVEQVKVRSPLTCRTLYGVCSKCYGADLTTGELIHVGEAVGIIAAQSIGEPGTQLTMRTFHIGGVAGTDITHGLPRVEELFEARTPKGKAGIAMQDGWIENIEERAQGVVITFVPGSKKDAKKGAKESKRKGRKQEFIVPPSSSILVKKGDEVKKGTKLYEGSVDLKELLELKGEREVQQFIIDEVQKIYAVEGASIHDKHIEIIVRQMFGRVRVKDPGDSPDLIVGEIIEKSRFLKINRELKKEGRTPAKAQQLLLGITRVALTTESFLSAASFQDTARVLVRAAVEGRLDPLRGLKENVIIGRLIPAGRKLDDEEEEEEEDTESEQENEADSEEAAAVDEGVKVK
ncbi:DNA-directed RNA polymerase subunit beta', partial [Candidatus Parcubacteria bacterium]